eukprot:5339873-Pyramimonas_sp.AAC.1
MSTIRLAPSSVSGFGTKTLLKASGCPDVSVRKHSLGVAPRRCETPSLRRRPVALCVCPTQSIGAVSSATTKRTERESQYTIKQSRTCEQQKQRGCVRCQAGVDFALPLLISPTNHWGVWTALLVAGAAGLWYVPNVRYLSTVKAVKLMG